MPVSNYTDWTLLLRSLATVSQPFASVEEQFLLSLLTEPPHDVSILDWHRLQKAYFAHPYIYSALNGRRALVDVPTDFWKLLTHSYRKNFVANTYRAKLTATLARSCAEAGIKVMFVKGAAEIARFHSNSDYLGRRFMADIDMLCYPKDLDAVDQLLRERGYEFSDYGVPVTHAATLRSVILSRHGAYLYNHSTKDQLELHLAVAVGGNTDSYPPGFSQLLLDHAEPVDLQGTKVLVPKPEHMLVYFICHAASAVNNNELIHFPTHHYDEFLNVDWAVDPWSAISRRLDAYQEFYLLKLKDFCEAIGHGLDVQEVSRLLEQVPNRELVDMHVDIAAFYLKDVFPVERKGLTYNGVCLQRQRYLNSTAIPQLIQIIEARTEENKLTERILKYLDKTFESRLASSIEASIEPRIEARIAPEIESRIETKIETSIEPRIQHNIQLWLGQHLRRRIRQRIRDFISLPMRRLKSSTRSDT